mgnify:FL=1
MGHALPPELRNELVKRARNKNENFVIWEENFTLTYKSKTEGYDAVVGYLPFDAHVSWKLKNLIKMLAEEKCPIPFFLTSETHNTPRTSTKEGGIELSKIVWTITAFLDGVHFIHSGFELGEKSPVNTGLCFTQEELQEYPSEKLPLFSTASMDWNSKDNLIDYIREINSIRNNYELENIFSNKDISNIKDSKLKMYPIYSNNENVFGFLRKVKNEKKYLLIIVNMNNYNLESYVELPFEITHIKSLTKSSFEKNDDNSIKIQISNYETMIFSLFY